MERCARSVTPSRARLRLAGCVAALLLAACADPTTTRNIELASCQSLRIAGDAAVLLRPGETAALQVTGSAPAVNDFLAEPGEGPDDALTLRSPARVSVVLECPCIESVVVQGAASVVAESGFQCPVQKLFAYGSSALLWGSSLAERLEVRAAASAAVKLEQTDAEHLLVFGQGQSQLSIDGMAQALSVELGGQSSLQAADLIAQTVRAKVRGDSKATVHATAHFALSATEQGRAVNEGPAPAQPLD